MNIVKVIFKSILILIMMGIITLSINVVMSKVVEPINNPIDHGKPMNSTLVLI